MLFSGMTHGAQFGPTYSLNNLSLSPLLNGTESGFNEDSEAGALNKIVYPRLWMP
jgi:hypothetical protein